MSMFRRTAAGILAVLALTSCAVGPTYQSPSPRTAASYAEAPVQGVTQDTDALAEWWRAFSDARLTSLVERAIASNLDVQVAHARLREARASLRYTQASSQLPTVDVDASYARSKDSTKTRQSLPAVSGGYDTYQFSFDASWEVDLFGGIRRQVEAATAEAQSYEENLRNTLVSVVAEVAKNYVQLRQYQGQLAVAQRRVAAWQDTLRITDVRNRAGLVTDADAATAKANLAAAQATIPTLESNARQTIHAIAVLLGRQPGELTGELSADGTIPTPPGEIPVGLPSDLLRRRPDVRQAERSLAASTAKIGVEVANLFPKIRLTGQVGGKAGAALNLTDAAARFYTLGPTIEWGILNYFSIQADIKTAETRRDQQFLTYQKTVLTAFKDVENALVAYTRESERQSLLTTQVTESRKAASVAMAKYTRGLTTFLEVLDSQRSLYAAEDAQVESRGTLSVDLIALYKALGGGWETLDPVTRVEDSPGGKPNGGA